MKIAIDGPAGAGKSTIAKLLANQLGYIYIDTGAMYRALTWRALKEGINLEDPNALHKLACNIKIHFEYNSTGQLVYCDKLNITREIRSPGVNAAVSKVAAYPLVRKVMLKRQQEMARNASVIMDGRDIGECVLPDADFKFFITASIEARSQRRIKELESYGYQVNPDAIKQEIVERDKNDAQREVGALKILSDSIVIDTSNLTIEQVLDQLISIIQR